MTVVDRIAYGIATVLKIGHLPVAPGTFGTLAAIPLAWSLAPYSAFTYALAAFFVTVVGVVASERVERSLGEHDSSRIVVDEVAGYLWTCLTIPRDDWRWLAAAFLVFRALDIAKPWPIGWVDRRMHGGLGVVMDDVVAGIIGSALLYGVTFVLAH
jgi:phosphatidylglycerophosphatase A